LTNENNGEKSVLNNSGIIGEISIITGEPRTATLNSLTKVVAWEIEKDSFLNLLNQTPKLKKSLNELIYQRTQNIVSTKTPSAKAWAGQLLRAIEIRRKGLHPWQIAMLIGFLGWLILFFNEHFALINLSFNELFIASLKLVFGFLILQGSCEALISGAERVGSRLKWDGFISGTMGSILSTLPEFVVVWFLVKVDPLMAIITSIVTIFNNSLAYSFYAFFLPKDKSGTFEMPKSLTIAGGEILIAGSATALIVGLVLLVMYITKVKSQLIGVDLLVVGGTLSAIYIFYILTLVKYYQEGSDNPNSLPPAPHNLGYNSKTSAIISLFLLGIIGSYCGGEAVGSFAETALSNTNMGKVTTSAILAFFAGISEYIIVYKSHKRGEMGIALS
ncbi:MAG: cyclic nucleotide-binding domain-containing protein, partial [Flavobacteriales bacterium]|nr:cyclic nucleotide-binding domain-containing protein [Flavobacteriales bacterium]